VVVVKNHPAVVITHDRVRVNFLRFVLSIDLDQFADAGVVPRRNVNLVSLHDRRWDDRGFAGIINLPKELAGFRVKAREFFLGEADELTSAIEIGRYEG
jgi:hypothetical protein